MTYEEGKMEYHKLGHTGLKVSALCLGTMTMGWTSSKADSFAVLDAFVEAGGNFLDTADVYSAWAEGNPGGVAETWIGEWLGHSGTPRHELVIATKVRARMWDGPNGEGLSRVHIMKAVEDSLRRLGTDYIDLYQTHWPDDDTPLDETLRALDDLVRQGKVRYLGCSNYAGWHIADAAWTSRVEHLHRFTSAQNRYSLMSRDIEREVIPACQAHGLGLLPYFPLESGLLSGKYAAGQAFPADSRLAKWGAWAAARFASEDNFARVAQLNAICATHSHSLLQLALGWLATRPTVASVIAGVTSIPQLEQNVAALQWRPAPEDLAEVDKVCPPPPALFGPGPAR
jgi:aryl-alcohol dehydrogenase-like predicted oxidoreductase